ncbi:MAG: hypothetical protein PQJ61_16460 [Spirochaetales bacterium]|uniref:Uncharacterized protein n=1 Tax=Candidatus Thalassospirochaeta sargassi TaxID=3119039 RepID=A0AAJ1II23_9SPIO|nr:hypothetical protein [Spirochaetales bacterium]
MTVLSIAIIVFILFESLNVLMLYFKPGSRMGNGIGVFNAYEKSKSDPEIHALVSYMINWVAGTKLIFIALLIVIVITGTSTTRILAVVAMILSIASYYWRLHPAIKKMDEAGWITPKGYSKILGFMIMGFMIIFAAALIVSLVITAGRG